MVQALDIALQLGLARGHKSRSAWEHQGKRRGHYDGALARQGFSAKSVSPISATQLGRPVDDARVVPAEPGQKSSMWAIGRVMGRGHQHFNRF